MSMFQRWSRRLMVAGLLAGMVSPVALAEQILTSADEPLQVELSTALQANKAHYGDPFEAVLKDSYRFEGKTIEAGTVFKGQVHSARKSLPFARPGYVTFDVQEAVLPNGDTYRFNEDGTAVLTSKKVLHPKALTIKKLVKSALPFSLVSAADSIPLKFAAGLSPLEIAPISVAARMTLGTILEFTEKEKQKHAEKNHPPQTRFGHGLLRGTGMTGAYQFTKPSPEPNLAAGEVIPLRFGEEQFASLFAQVGAAARTAAVDDGDGPQVQLAVEAKPISKDVEPVTTPVEAEK